MRPIWIKIKGLNSFLEPQEIDFQELTGEGLFGIFGPTGSGKSSILDGITLALYGTTARNSTNFIHVSTDKALVDYIFSVQTKEIHTYRVTRGFKRSKEGSIRSDGARFLEILEDREEVLADKVGSVNEKCREVIGLSKEDFFRTVVLPQGKFSEFLKLDGMERNKMLERLFHLEKYGESLVQIIRGKVQQWQGKEKEQLGALSRYGEITREKVRELKEKEKTCQEQFQKDALKLQESRKKLEEEKVRFEAQKEYDSLEKEARLLEGQQGEMLLAEERIGQAQKAERLWKVLQDFLQGQENLTERREKLEQLLGEQKKLEQEKAVLEEQVKTAQEKKQKDLPDLEIQRIRLEEGSALLAGLKTLEAESQNKKKALEDRNRQLQEDQAKLEKLENDLKLYEEEREKAAFALNKVKVTAQEQETIQEGYRLWMELGRRKEEEKRKKEELGQLLARQEKENGDQQKLAEEKAQAASRLLEVQEKRKEDEAALAGLAHLESFKERLSRVEEEQVRKKALEEQKKELAAQEEKLMQELQRAQEVKNLAMEEKARADEAYRKNLAYILARDLKEGQPCPVCGSIHHESLSCSMEDQENPEEKREQAERKLQEISGSITRLKTLLENNRQQEKVRKEEEGRLNREFLQMDLEEEKKNLSVKEQEREKLTEKTETEKKTETEIQNRILELEKSIAGKKARIESLGGEGTRKQKELDKLQDEIEDLENGFESLSRKVSKEDFPGIYQELQEKNQRREKCQEYLEKLETAIEARRKSREKGTRIIQEEQNEKTRLEAELLRMEKELQEKKEQIREKTGTAEGLEEKKESLLREKQTLETYIKEQEEQWQLFQEREKRIGQELASGQALATEGEKEVRKREAALKESMAEEEVESISWIQARRMEREELETLREKLEAFQNKVLSVKSRMDSVKVRLKGEKISEAQMEERKKRVQDLENRQVETNRILGGLRKEREQTEKAWKEKEALEEKMGQIRHKLDLLQELEGLFRGKKFVEYVARYYMEYVSREADEKLKEMTGNSLGLETDQSGMFIIRDYKNGGATRPASTLSGGETFMASLALALALSSQIQMKGAAPMELFFLDEGFGTLDEKYLEIVMEALEKIRDRKRSVGVISHVEEIKARIPVRLIVEPSRAGEGGSKIHIERE